MKTIAIWTRFVTESNQTRFESTCKRCLHHAPHLIERRSMYVYPQADSCSRTYGYDIDTFILQSMKLLDFNMWPRFSIEDGKTMCRLGCACRFLNRGSNTGYGTTAEENIAIPKTADHLKRLSGLKSLIRQTDPRLYAIDFIDHFLNESSTDEDLEDFNEPANGERLSPFMKSWLEWIQRLDPVNEVDEDDHPHGDVFMSEYCVQEFCKTVDMLVASDDHALTRFTRDGELPLQDLFYDWLLAYDVYDFLDLCRTGRTLDGMKDTEDYMRIVFRRPSVFMVKALRQDVLSEWASGDFLSLSSKYAVDGLGDRLSSVDRLKMWIDGVKLWGGVYCKDYVALYNWRLSLDDGALKNWSRSIHRIMRKLLTTIAAAAELCESSIYDSSSGDEAGSQFILDVIKMITDRFKNKDLLKDPEPVFMEDLNDALADVEFDGKYGVGAFKV